MFPRQHACLLRWIRDRVHTLDTLDTVALELPGTVDPGVVQLPTKGSPATRAPAHAWGAPAHAWGAPAHAWGAPAPSNEAHQEDQPVDRVDRSKQCHSYPRRTSPSSPPSPTRPAPTQSPCVVVRMYNRTSSIPPSVFSPGQECIEFILVIDIILK